MAGRAAAAGVAEAVPLRGARRPGRGLRGGCGRPGAGGPAGPLAGDGLAHGGLPGRRLAGLELLHRPGQPVVPGRRAGQGAGLLRLTRRSEASATLADAAGDVPGQAATVPAAMPARASAEPAAMRLILGVLRCRVLRCRVLRWRVWRWRVVREGARRLRDNVNLRSGAFAPAGFHPGHRPATQGAGAGQRRRMRRGGRAPGRSEGGGHRGHGVLARSQNARDGPGRGRNAAPGPYEKDHTEKTV